MNVIGRGDDDRVKVLDGGTQGLYLLPLVQSGKVRALGASIHDRERAAGGNADSRSRQVAKVMGSLLGQPIIIENRPTGIIQGEIVAKAPPDGHTVMVNVASHSGMLRPASSAAIRAKPIGMIACIIQIATPPDSTSVDAS